MENTIHKYAVSIDGPKGRGVLEVNSALGPKAAGRRALVAALRLGWGELDDLSVENVEDEGEI